MSPSGEVFHQRIAEELVNEEHLILLCSHYEGVDQRILDSIVDREISCWGLHTQQRKSCRHGHK